MASGDGKTAEEILRAVYDSTNKVLKIRASA